MHSYLNTPSIIHFLLVSLFIFKEVNVNRQFKLHNIRLYGPRRDKTCLWGFGQSEFQNSLLSYREYLEN